MNEFAKLALVAVIVLLVLCIAPFLGIWAVNTILEQSGVATQIPHNGWTYLATIVFLVVMKSNVTITRK